MLDLIKIVNTGDKPIVLKHDGKGHVTIDPHRFRILTSDYAFIYFGDPRAFDAGKEKTRTVEFENTRTLWGFYPGLMPEAAWEGRAFDPSTGEEIGPFKPQVECYDMDDERVYMVMDDPDGSVQASLTGVPTLDQSDAVERNAMQQMLAAQQEQINKLTALVLAKEAGVPGSDTSDAPEDEDDEDEDDEGEDSNGEGDDPEPKPTPAKRATKASKAAAAAAEQTAGQADRNEARDSIPTAPADEPPVKRDGPKTTRVGGK